MLEALKKVFSGKSDEESIMKTASIIRERAGSPEVATLEDAVSTVISAITMGVKRAAFQDDLAATGQSPDEAEYLIPSVLLGMLLTQRMWGILEEKFDGGKVASYVALRHCLDNPKKDSMAVFARSAGIYNVMRQNFEEKGEDFNNKLTALIVSSFRNADTDSAADIFRPIYSLIRQQEKEILPA